LKKGSAQTQYQIIYIIWLLSFEEEICENLEKFQLFNSRRYHVTPVLKDIAQSAIKEKVVRVVLATFKNLLVKAPRENTISLLGHKVLALIETFSGRKWADPEIVEDINFLKEDLKRHVDSLTTFDEYYSELQSRKLEWSPPHLSEQFWKTNATRLNDNQCELVKILVELIKNSKDSVVLAVAAHDIGQYVKYADNGRK
jgi:V-type H+-transporting ATPase subunit H